MKFIDSIKSFSERFIFNNKSNISASENIQNMNLPAIGVRTENYTARSSEFSGGISSGGQKTRNGITGDNRGFILDHRRLLLNSRTRYHDSIEAHAIVDRFAQTVAGKGLTLELEPKHEIIGISADEASAKASQIMDRWELFRKSKTYFRDESMTGYQTDMLYQKYRHRDNDLYIRYYYSKRNDLLSHLQVSFIDSMQIVGNAYTSTLGQIFTNDGIVRDNSGREIAYRVANTNPQTGVQTFEEIPAYGPRSGRRIMAHCYSPDYAGQGRGYSRISHAIHELSNLTDLSVAHIQKAKNQAALTMAIETEPGSAAGNPFDGILKSASGGLASSATPPPSDAPDAQYDVSYSEMPEATVTQPGVGLFDLGPGRKVVNLKDTAPNEAYGAFTAAFVSSLAASANMPYEVMLMKFANNYSASRATLLLFWDIIETEREEMISDYLQPTFEAWLGEEIALGRIALPGWSDPVLRAAWTHARWYGSPMPEIDSVKAATAAEKWLKLNATTLRKVSKNHNGSDIQSNQARLQREYADYRSAPWDIKKAV